MVPNFYSHIITTYLFYVLHLMLKPLLHWYYVDILYKNKAKKILRGYLNESCPQVKRHLHSHICQFVHSPTL